ncbi:MAG: RNA methyltransferase substrate-binding domain-containing protein, partial [Waterburya sp.]
MKSKPKVFVKQQKKIPSRHQPADRPLADLDQPKEDLDLTYGRHAVLAALKGDRQINRIWVTDKLLAHGQFYPLIKDAKANGTIIDEVDSRRLSQLTQGGNHQGIA